MKNYVKFSHFVSGEKHSVLVKCGSVHRRSDKQNNTKEVSSSFLRTTVHIKTEKKTQARETWASGQGGTKLNKTFDEGLTFSFVKYSCNT